VGTNPADCPWTGSDNFEPPWNATYANHEKRGPQHREGPSLENPLPV